MGPQRDSAWSRWVSGADPVLHRPVSPPRTLPIGGKFSTAVENFPPGENFPPVGKVTARTSKLLPGDPRRYRESAPSVSPGAGWVEVVKYDEFHFFESFAKR